MILTAGTALSLPVVYGLPFFRLAERLGRSGGAVAGAYGASQLDRCREMVLTDSDLFPPGCVRLKKTTIYEDDRQKVAVFAGSLAEELNADVLIILTAVEKVAVNFGKPDQKWLDHLTPEKARQYAAEGQFAPGSMLPKVEAAVKFAESKPGRTALITLLEKAKAGIAGETGTSISL